MLVEVKVILDKLASQETESILAEAYTLNTPGLSETDIQCVESTLGIKFPPEYRDALHRYDWSTLQLGYLRLYATPKELIGRNASQTSEFGNFYRESNLCEIGAYEADVVCIYLSSVDGGTEGQIVYINHNDHPNVCPEFVSSSFERFLLCAVTDRVLKEKSGYYRGSIEAAEKEELHQKIMKAILDIDPAAVWSSFWYKYIRGI